MIPVLEVKNLTKTFSRAGQTDIAAVDHVSFSVQPGECVGLIGESGSGKSTLANLITRLESADSGSIFLDSTDITACTGRALKKVYRKIQMVFQSPAESFDPRRRLGYGIAESLLNNGCPKSEALPEAKRLLAECGLDASFADRYPHEVSGGQCQRAAIARALAISPELLICDEITSALDAAIQQEIMELLKKLRAEPGSSLSILFICHDISLVRSFCDRVLVMYRGRIVEQGDAQQVLQDPQDPYTKSLVEAARLFRPLDLGRL